MKKRINVVVAIIENEAAEIQCALRSSTISLPNLWEFPGEKVDSEESEIEALKREIKEELLCEIQVISPFDDYILEWRHNKSCSFFSDVIIVNICDTSSILHLENCL